MATIKDLLSKMIEKINGIPTKLSDLEADIDIGAQSDWNQNDENASDYVKNRPFYTSDPVETIIVEETTIEQDSFEDWDGVYGCEITLSQPIELNQNYTVVFDGAAYELTAFYDEGFPTIGSTYNELVDNTGLPFHVACIDGVGYLVVKEYTNHAISIVGMIPRVHKLDEKYLPSFVLRTDLLDKKYLKICFPIESYTKIVLDYMPEYGYDSVITESVSLYTWKEFVNAMDIYVPFYNNREICDIQYTYNGVIEEDFPSSLVFNCNYIVIAINGITIIGKKMECIYNETNQTVELKCIDAKGLLFNTDTGVVESIS